MSKSIQLKNKDNEKMYPHPYYPVGSIYLSVNDANPSNWFGGSWELIAQGRTLVGVDTNDTNFNTVKKTGGNKEHTHTTGDCALTIEQIPSHRHTINDPFYKFSELTYGMVGQVFKGDKYQEHTTYTDYTGGNKAHNHGSTGSSNNFPPYFTCYIWCRTA